MALRVTKWVDIDRQEVEIRIGAEDIKQALDEQQQNTNVSRLAACGLIWRAAGSPAMAGSSQGLCSTCGDESVGQPFSTWVRPTFTDWDKIEAGGQIICHACQFCFTDQNQPLAARVGKEAPQRTRNYSHFVADGEWIPLSKAHKSRMRSLLLQKPSVAIIADSGQKHIIFRAKSGWWQFEEFSLRPFPDALRAIVPIIEGLYLGFSKTEIGSGRYGQKRIRDFGMDRWRELECLVRPMRGSPALLLALFLVQKEDQEWKK